MYYAIVLVLTLILPVVSGAVEIARSPVASVPLVFGRWFVFWGVGVRLFLAGLRQSLQPAYTAKHILGIEDPDSLIVVRELGFANLGLGSVGLGSLFVTGWSLAAALAGLIFYGLAGLNHTRDPDRTRPQSVAMVSDFFMFLVLATYAACALTY